MKSIYILIPSILTYVKIILILWCCGWRRLIYVQVLAQFLEKLLKKLLPPFSLQEAGSMLSETSITTSKIIWYFNQEYCRKHTAVSTWDLIYSLFFYYFGRSDVNLPNNLDHPMHLTEYARTFVFYLYRTFMQMKHM